MQALAKEFQRPAEVLDPSIFQFEVDFTVCGLASPVSTMSLSFVRLVRD
jgi:hypothetical protein